jgi:hypothetical protein
MARSSTTIANGDEAIIKELIEFKKNFSVSLGDLDVIIIMSIVFSWGVLMQRKCPPHLLLLALKRLVHHLLLILAH